MQTFKFRWIRWYVDFFLTNVVEIWYARPVFLDLKESQLKYRFSVVGKFWYIAAALCASTQVKHVAMGINWVGANLLASSFLSIKENPLPWVNSVAHAVRLDWWPAGSDGGRDLSRNLPTSDNWSLQTMSPKQESLVTSPAISPSRSVRVSLYDRLARSPSPRHYNTCGILLPCVMHRPMEAATWWRHSPTTSVKYRFMSLPG